MCILAVDTETIGLNARAFLMGAVASETETVTLFNNPKEMWNHILRVGASEAKRRRNVYVYAHNHEYDFYGYADLRDKSVRFVSFRPFIAKRGNIWFLDTYAVSRSPLSELASFIGMEKMPTPKRLKEGGFTYDDFHSDFVLKAETSQYLQNDTMMVLKFVLAIRDKVRDEGVGIRRVVSAGQIGLSFFMKEIRHSLPQWIPEDKLGIKSPGDTAQVHKAYRGGRTEAFQTGSFDDTHGYDCNSMYPFALGTVPLPDLDTRKEIPFPKSVDELGDISFVNAAIFKPESVHCVPVRYEGNQVFPHQDAVVFGAYTKLELEAFIDYDCDILHLWDAVSFDALPNPLMPFVKDKYALRANSSFDKSFWKLVLNNIVGKLAMSREEFELRIDDWAKDGVMKDEGYELAQFFDDVGVFVRHGDVVRSRCYVPMVSAYVTAWSRMHLYEHLQRIPYESLLYCDTDGVLCMGDHSSFFALSDAIGDWKVTHSDDYARIYGKKAYRAGENIALAGVPRAVLKDDPSAFDRGIIQSQRMQGIRKSLQFAGSFTPETIDLNKTERAAIAFRQQVMNETMFIDDGLDYGVPKDIMTEVSDEIRRRCLI